MSSQTKAGRLNSSGHVFPHSLTLIVFGISLFLSASLMFAVQPMIGKMLLPLAGGTPASWIVAMAFFQIALLMGYMLAWIMSRFDVRTHTLLLVALLGLGFTFLPVRIADYANILETDGISPGTIFAVLLFAVGLPFTALSTVSSTLQRLFTATTHKDAKDPYFLYAASNTGSLIGLLSYPLMIEPLLPVYAQSSYWQILYGGLIAMCLICLGFANHKEGQAVEKKIKAAEKADHEEITWRTRITWLLLAFFPSSLLMGTTSHITMDVVSAPLLWVVPLGLYLMTHILAFSKRDIVPKYILYIAHPIAAALLVMLSCKLRVIDAGWTSAGAILTVFFIIALALHTRLAEIRPHSKHLTQFYFFLALGGALGGSFNAFLAPVIFKSVIEFPVIALLSCFANPNLENRHKNFHLVFLGLVLLVFHFFGSWVILQTAGGFESDLHHLLLLGILALMIGHHPATTLVCTTGILLFTQLFMPVDTLAEYRNFFGVMRVYDKEGTVPGKAMNEKFNMRYFMHGTTLHGVQWLDAKDLKDAPITSYYGPLITAINAFQPKHVALLGLGAGTIRCYHAPDRYYTMYEIDPEVVEIAQKYFNYLKDCGNENDVYVVGDGRLEMQKRENDRYDMIIMDAFTSDSVPVHLITVEALQLYRARLTERGIIAIHISNRYLDFKQLLPQVGALNDLVTYYRYQPAQKGMFQVASQWIIFLPKGLDGSQLLEEGWLILPPQEDVARPWTDSYSSILSILRK